MYDVGLMMWAKMCRPIMLNYFCVLKLIDIEITAYFTKGNRYCINF